MNETNSLARVENAIEPQAEKPEALGTTPMQAKVDAIASLTMSAYAKAATLILTADEMAELSADFPDDAFKPGAAGKENLIYIEHAFLRERLNKVFHPGQWAIVPRNRWAEPFQTQRGVEGSRVYVEAMLVIRGAFIAEAVGEMEYYPSNAMQNYGDAVEGAKTAALRRCCKELGIGLQAWKKDWCDGWWRRRGKAPARSSNDDRTIPTDRRPTPTTQTQNHNAPTSTPDTGWRAFKITFGQQKDQTLGSLKPESLRWWIESWTPKPFKGQIDPAALKLRKALDVAASELGYATPPMN